MCCAESLICARLWLNGLQSARLLCSCGFSRQEYWSGLPCPPPGDLPNPGIEPWSPSMQVDSLPSEPPGKPKSTGVGSLSLLQGIFPTQGLNWNLPHCRQIFYQLSYQESPKKQISVFKYSYQLRQNNHTHILKSNYCNVVSILCYSGLCLIISVTRVDCFSKPEMIDSNTVKFVFLVYVEI